MPCAEHRDQDAAGSEQTRGELAERVDLAEVFARVGRVGDDRVDATLEVVKRVAQVAVADVDLALPPLRDRLPAPALGLALALEPQQARTAQRLRVTRALEVAVEHVRLDRGELARTVPRDPTGTRTVTGCNGCGAPVLSRSEQLAPASLGAEVQLAGA